MPIKISKGKEIPGWSRRRWLSVLPALGLFHGLPLRAGRGFVKIVAFDENGRRLGVSEVEKIKKTEAEWRKQLREVLPPVA